MAPTTAGGWALERAPSRAGWPSRFSGLSSHPPSLSAEGSRFPHGGLWVWCRWLRGRVIPMRVMLRCKGLGFFSRTSRSCPPLDAPGLLDGGGSTLRAHTGVPGPSAFGAGALLSPFVVFWAAAAPSAVSDPAVQEGAGGDSLSALNLPALGWRRRVHRHARLPRESSRAGGSDRSGAVPLGWEERLSLGSVREGARVQVASCSQHLCLIG